MRLTVKAMERVRREFFPEDYPRAPEILRRWDTRARAPGKRPSRMLAAVPNLAVGNLDSLEHFIAEAAMGTAPHRRFHSPTIRGRHSAIF